MSITIAQTEPLKPISVDLAGHVPGRVGGEFSQVNQTITAVDGWGYRYDCSGCRTLIECLESGLEDG